MTIIIGCQLKDSFVIGSDLLWKRYVGEEVVDRRLGKKFHRTVHGHYVVYACKTPRSYLDAIMSMTLEQLKRDDIWYTGSLHLLAADIKGSQLYRSNGNRWDPIYAYMRILGYKSRRPLTMIKPGDGAMLGQHNSRMKRVLRKGIPRRGSLEEVAGYLHSYILEEASRHYEFKGVATYICEKGVLRRHSYEG